MYRNSWNNVFKATALALVLPLMGIGCTAAMKDIVEKDYQGNIKYESKDGVLQAKVAGARLVGAPLEPSVVRLKNSDTTEVQKTEYESKGTPPPPPVVAKPLPEYIEGPTKPRRSCEKGKMITSPVIMKVPEEYRTPPQPAPAPQAVTNKETLTVTTTRSGGETTVTGPTKFEQVTGAIVGVAAATGEVMTGVGAMNLGKAALDGKMGSGDNINYAAGGEGGKGGNAKIEKGAVAPVIAPNMTQVLKSNIENTVDVSVKTGTPTKPHHDKKSHHNNKRQSYKCD
jgi:hypothetical protein